MPDEHPTYQELEARIARLEAKVQYLQEQIEGKTTGITVESAGANSDADMVVLDTANTPPEAETPGLERDQGRDWLRADENWLNRIGIGLLLLGVAFLFKYSIDQGWLVPALRSAIGLGIGLALFISGLQMKGDRSTMPQLLLGGGIAAFYITGFATYQLYHFISGPVVWVFMVCVTLIALSFSLQQGQPILSVVGVLGGLGTPFMLYTGQGSLYSLMIYSGLVLGGATIIYLYKGWKSLLWAMVLGGWLVMLVGFFTNIIDERHSALADQWSLQAGIFICLICFWIVPVIREKLSRYDPKRWPNPSYTHSFGILNRQIVFENNSNVSVMALTTPVLALLYSTGLWDLSWETWGVIAMACSLIIGYTYLPLRSKRLPGLASVHGFTALIMLTLSFLLLLEGEFLFFILALEALGLRFVARNTNDEKISLSSHILFGIIGIWFIYELAERIPAAAWPAIDADALIQLAIIGIAGLATPIWLEEQRAKTIYRLAAHFALLGWFLYVFSGIDNGQAYISVCWGIYALIILVIGFVRDLSWLRLAGMATIFLVVAKLFLVDLSQLQAIWRILLFIGFGALFLIIGYFVQVKFGNDQASGKTSSDSKNM